TPLTITPHPIPTPFPYTTLFRSERQHPGAAALLSSGDAPATQLSERRHAQRATVEDPERLVENAGQGDELLGIRVGGRAALHEADRKSTRLNSSHEWISYAVFCL